MIPRPLAALLAAAFISSLSWALVLPPFQGPDELSHVSYVERLVETRELPRTVKRTDGRYSPLEATALLEWSQGGQLIGNPGARPAFTQLEEDRWKQADAALPASKRTDGTGVNPASNNGPVYYAYEAVPYVLASSGSLVDRLYLMRVASIVFLLLTVVFAWMLAGELLGKLLWPRVLATGSVALLPQFQQLSGVVSPDSALAAVWTAFLWLAVVTVKRGLSRGRLLGLAGLCAASALTHPRGVAIVVPALAAVLFAYRRNAERTKRPAGVWIAVGAVLALGVAAAALLLARNANSLPVLSGSAEPLDPREFVSYVWQFYLPKLGFMNDTVGIAGGGEGAFIRTFYGAFAWQEFGFPAAVYDLLKWISLAGIVAVVVAIVRRRPPLDLVALLAIAVLSVLALLHVTEYWAFLNTQGPVIVGRNLFPLVGIFGCAIAFVAMSLPRRFGPVMAGLVLGGGVVLTIGGLANAVVRFHG